MLTGKSSSTVVPFNLASHAQRCRATRSAAEILAEFGLPSPSNGKDRYYATCPQCSAYRSTAAHRNAKVLGITIDNDGVRFGCNHCGWTGGGFYESPEKQFSQQPQFTAIYDYCDESGELLFQVCRKANKEFPQRRPASNGGWQWGLDKIRRVLYRLPQLIEAVGNDQVVFIVEGEKDADRLASLNIPATCNPGGASEEGKKPKWRDEYNEHLRRASVVVVCDNDSPGRAHAQAVAQSLSGTASRIRLFDPAKHWPDCPENGDISDWLDAGHSVEQLWKIVEALPNWSPIAASPEDRWPQPKELPSELAKVHAFDPGFLPEKLAPWVNDISDRLQCPPDYVAVAAVTALGATIGRRIAIAPQQKTDWYEVPNLWGAPGMLKSPAMNEALKPLRHLEAEAAKSFEIAQEAYSVGISEFKLRAEVKKSLQKEHLKKTGGNATGEDGKPFTFDLGEEPKEPVAVRFRTNDSSYEKLGELLVDNPAGILIERDELISLLRHLDKDDQANARGFYLSGWSGTSPYTFDRIVRGYKHIDAVCVSILGNTQPSRIAEYVWRANADNGGGDGLIQRFGLLVWPDSCPDWRDVDEYPDSKAREAARDGKRVRLHSKRRSSAAPPRPSTSQCRFSALTKRRTAPFSTGAPA